jgi:non-homologous end joining protein Ku
MPESEQRPKAQVIDLMEALKASLGKKSGAAARRVAPKKAAKSRKRA